MEAKLYYFDGRGRGELVRLTLAASGIKFTEEITRDRETYLKWIADGKLLFKQIPMLEIDGKMLSQTGAIVRYLARKAGLYGQNDDEAFLVDMFFEAGRDFYLPVTPIAIRESEEEVLKRCKEGVLQNLLPVFERRARENGNNGYLVGSKLSLADISVLEGLLVYVEYLGKEILNDYPAVKKFYDTVTGEPKLAAYLSGPQRKRKNDERYAHEVKLSLGRK